MSDAQKSGMHRAFTEPMQTKVKLPPPAVILSAIALLSLVFATYASGVRFYDAAKQDHEVWRPVAEGNISELQVKQNFLVERQEEYEEFWDEARTRRRSELDENQRLADKFRKLQETTP